MIEECISLCSANIGCQVWIKAMPDGHTAAVRIYPAEKRDTDKEYADDVSHTHKEIVPSENVSNGNYAPPKQSGAILCDDNGEVASTATSKASIFAYKKEYEG